MKYTLVMILVMETLIFNVSTASSKNLSIDKDQNGNIINAHAGGIIYKDGKYYWYGEYRSPKVNNHTQWDSNQKVNLYESTDLKNWNYIGVILDLSQDTHNWDLERPKIIYNKKNKEFVMWFHLEPNRKYTEGYAGVAVSNNIAGPFKLIKYDRPNKGIAPIENYQPDNKNWFVKKANEKFSTYFNKGQQVRDLTTYVDDNGKAYIIYESEDDYSLQVVELTEDYKNFTKKYSRILIGQQNEAPAIIKYNGKLFLITSGLTGYKANPPRLYESSDIFGPWKPKGSPIMVDNKRVNKNLLDSQPSFIFKKNNGEYVLMMDKWDTSAGGYSNLWKSSYTWITLQFNNNTPTIME
ncbi:glycoside hydrolase family 43 protein [Tatumella ptyseos]|uniref:glycoside hydrolase family 43 protein n=1 Tax=Tatumella ptyseos TaxID=82987 RepID=UPI0026F17B89|nr:glycoside hydrolase family 43 protein [Tatumella ptyseos]WKX27173.1 glycoside hydrolase family 43 protein [Tatumella ptyseos]